VLFRSVKILDTQRLVVRLLHIDDAPFILKLVNEPSWIQFIGDRGIRTIEAARDYIVNGPLAMQKSHGLSLYMTELKAERTPIGICGLIKRDTLEDVDIGFAFLPEYWGKGYAHESAVAVLEYGRNMLGLQRIVAITSPENLRSIKLLESLGLQFEKKLQMHGETRETSLYALNVAKA
jgi:RimJ/RimL family protein N-acetyltransferase